MIIIKFKNLLRNKNNFAHKIKAFLPYSIKKNLKLILDPIYYGKIYWRDFLTSIGYYKFPYNIIFVAGLPKSGTTWVENFLYNIPGYSPRILYGDKNIIINQNLPKNAFSHFPKNKYSFVKTHTNPNINNFRVMSQNKIKKAIIMWRDPRDVAISRHHHLMKKPKKEGEPHYIEYWKYTKNELITHSIKVIFQDYIPWMEGWKKEIEKKPDKYLLVRYEDLKDNHKEEFKKILDFYKIYIDDIKFNTIMEKIKIMKKRKQLYGKKIGKKSTFRKGISGDWKNHFNDSHKDLFKEHAGDFLIEFGYEKDQKW